MDLIAEYASEYGGVPRDDQPWHEVLALIVRSPRFASRRVIELTAGAALTAPTADADGRREMMIAGLERTAFPFRQGARGA